MTMTIYCHNGGGILKTVELIVGTCIQKGYVSEDEIPWLRYALEKRITSVFAFIPLLFVGLLVTSPATLFAFFVTFFLLRSQTNGYHAKSVGRCLFYSILGEIFFLKVLPMVWNDTIAFVALVISSVLIWVLAPYNHPNMNLFPEEILACAKSVKWRLGLLVFALSVLSVWEQEQFAEGIILGIVMTASALAMAYCSQKTMLEEKC